ncbi:glycosyltransferase [Candidatus Poribacteria bacterium]|nr:glycosyltransferase [Candidatus Poribacteria bacterium]
MTNPISCILNWQPSSVHGWGVYGINLALNWLREGRLFPIFSQAFQMELIRLDPIRQAKFHTLHQATTELERQLLQQPVGQNLNLDLPVVHALANGLKTNSSFNQQMLISSCLTGVVFFEDTNLTLDAFQRANLYRLIITGSTWNQRVLEANGCKNVTTIMQGVDHTIFHAENRASPTPERFLVFSGGKLEFRKGQDLVVKAFSRFVEIYPDAVLVTAWHSPWQNLAQELDHSGITTPIVYDQNGRVNVSDWLIQNGIPSQNFMDLGLIPNNQIANTIRQMDLALFPNRAEGGTNLVAMECMACGIPVILSGNTGHLDLVQDGNCLILKDQKPVSHFKVGTDGWGESQVDEIMDHLIFAYNNRDYLAHIGAQGADFMKQYSWEKQSAKLGDLILALSGN